MTYRQNFNLIEIVKKMINMEDNWPNNVKKTLEYPNEPLYKILENTAEKSGELPYTIFSGTTTTYAEANLAANKVANFLIQNGASLVYQQL